MSDIIGHNEPFQAVICNDCKHFYRFKSNRFCKAFKEVPHDVVVGKTEHFKPLPEQENDVVFEPVKKPRWYKPKD